MVLDRFQPEWCRKLQQFEGLLQVKEGALAWHALYQSRSPTVSSGIRGLAESTRGSLSCFSGVHWTYQLGLVKLKRTLEVCNVQERDIRDIVEELNLLEAKMYGSFPNIGRAFAHPSQGAST